MKPTQLIVLSLSFALFAMASKKDPQQNVIVEKRNVPLTIATFLPAKSHEVKSHWRLAYFSLKITPFVVQSFDKTTTRLAMEVKNKTTWPGYSSARVVITADGKALGSFMQDWIIDGQGMSETESTTIVDSNGLFRNMIAGQDVYLTIMFLGTAPPFDQMNFKLSPDQLSDLRMLADKYDALRAEVH